MGTPTVSAKEFLSAVWGDQHGFGEIRLIGKGKPHQEFFRWPAESEKVTVFALSKSGEANVYFGVGLRKAESGKAEDVLSLNAAWVDIDFKSTPRDEAIRLLNEFPLKASIGVLSGAGLHVYFLFREPATGGDLQKVKRINKGLARALKGDPASHDIARILRVIGTLNVKYDPPTQCEIAPGVWRPDFRYNLSEFDFVLQDDKHEPTGEAAPRCPVPLPEGSKYVDGRGGRPGDEFNKKASWEEILSAHEWRVSHKEGKVTYWIRPGKTEGHSATTGYCGDLLYVFSSNAQPFEAATAYTKFAAYAVLNHAGDFGKAAGDLSKQGYGGKSAKERRSVQPDFEIVKLVKFNSRPARYTIELKCEDDQVRSCTTETDKHVNYVSFRNAFYEENDLFLAPISQSKWEELLTEAKAKRETRDAPKEARVDGAVEMSLEEFLRHKKEAPELGDLKAFAGYDEEQTFFKLATFKGFLRDQGIKAPDQLVTYQLKHLGWESAPRRFGDDVMRVWTRREKENGHKPPDQPTQPPENPFLTRARAREGQENKIEADPHLF